MSSSRLLWRRSRSHCSSACSNTSLRLAPRATRSHLRRSDRSTVTETLALAICHTSGRIHYHTTTSAFRKDGGRQSGCPRRPAHGTGPRDRPALEGLKLPPLGWDSRGFVVATKTLLLAVQEPRLTVRLAERGSVFEHTAETREARLRAFDKATGDLLGEIELPANGRGRPHDVSRGEPTVHRHPDRRWAHREHGEEKPRDRMGANRQTHEQRTDEIAKGRTNGRAGLRPRGVWKSGRKCGRLVARCVQRDLRAPYRQ